MDERRRYKRVPANNIIWYSIKDYDKMQNYDDDVDIGIPLESVDISLGGAKIIHSKNLEKGSYLKTIVSLPSHSEPIIIVARVIWSHSISEKKFAVGLEFEKFLNDKKDILKEYIDNIKSKD